MKVIFSLQNNNVSKPQNQLTFEAGLTPKMAHEIRTADVLEISDRLEQKGIPVDFKNNKVVAWCCDRAVGVIEQVNQRFGTNLSLPKGIFITDFRDLKIDDPKLTGFCNLAPMALLKGNDTIFPSRIILFNSRIPWNHIDEISDRNYASRNHSTDFFLYPFFHELSHVSHEDHLLESCDGEAVLQKILSAQDPEKIREYQRKYGGRIAQICNYALTNPIEAVGCDMPVKIIASLDKENLTSIRNPFVGTPYEKSAVSREYSDRKRPLQEILRRFWNGEFD